MFTNPFGWRLDAELISVRGLTISNHAQCGVPQGLFLVRSIITHFSAMCLGGSNCKYPFLLPFYDEISLCTRPSSLSFCDEKYPGCPFYAWTPWLFFLFSISLLSNMLMPVPRSRIFGAPVRNWITQLSSTTTCGVTAGRYFFLVSRATKILSWLWPRQ